MSERGENVYKRKGERKSSTDLNRQLEIKDEVQQADLYSGTPSCKYATVLDEWLAMSKIRVKESTFACYFRIVNSHIREELGSCNINELTTMMIEQFISDKLSSGNLNSCKGLSPKTVSDILFVIKSTLEYARCQGLDVRCNLSRVVIKRSTKEIRVLTRDEQAKLVKVLLADMDLYKFGTLLSLYTGIRIGELCSLQWQDFSPDSCVLSVRKTIQRVQNTDREALAKTKVIITEPKSQCSVRDIPIPAFLREYVEQFRSEDSAYILSGRQDKYVEPRTMQNHFKAFVRQSKIADANFHSLRHTFATRCVEVGFDIKSLSEILGHSNVNITLNRYVHSSFELKASNMSKLSLEV
ncbi:MAG: site-specific integrase [Ruminococcus sp.]|nr:site-specific integrase [Ruminococcus sp.]